MCIQIYIIYSDSTLINNGVATKEDLEQIEPVKKDEEVIEDKPVKKAGRPKKTLDDEVKD